MSIFYNKSAVNRLIGPLFKKAGLKKLKLYLKFVLFLTTSTIGVLTFLKLWLILLLEILQNSFFRYLKGANVWIKLKLETLLPNAERALT